LEHPFVRRTNFEERLTDSQDSLAGSAKISQDGALTGDLGLAVKLNSSGQLRSFFRDPLEELGLRVTVDLKGVVTGEGEMFSLLTAGPNAMNLARRTIRLRLATIGGQPHLAAHVFDDNGGTQVVDWRPVPERFELELRIQSSSAEVEANGLAQLWIGDELVEVFHVPNSSLGVRWLYLGAEGVDAGTSGTLRFDDLMIWQ
jgi:hypothetical protein